MNCIRCQTYNEEGAQFCKNCGTRLHQAAPQANKTTSDVLLIVFAIFTLVYMIAFVIINSLDVWNPAIKNLQGGLWILQNISFILPALAIKNRTLKVIALIISAVFIIYWIYGNVQYMLS